jgi:ADP-ribosylglycohydrolase
VTDERAVACFKGLAIGDAVGKQTETLKRADVLRYYPTGITGFHGSPGAVIPRYAGRSYQWRIGETTDDTEQTLAVATTLLRHGEARHEQIGAALLRCTKSVHPPLSIWRFQQLGDPARVAETGDGCGAAMRVAPVGVAYGPDPLDRLIGAAYQCSIPTHGGQLAISAAAAVAGAVSAAVEGWSPDAVLATAIAAARAAERLRPASGGNTVAASLGRLYSDLESRERIDVDYLSDRYFPDNPINIVPLAIALGLVTRSAETSILLAADLGGDSDTVASIGGAIAGALHPETISDLWFDVIRDVNGDDIEGTALALAGMRRGSTAE